MRIICIIIFAWFVCTTPFFFPGQPDKGPIDWFIMHGFLGMTDMQWCNAIYLLGAMLFFAFGYLHPKTEAIGVAAIALGFPAHVFCNVFLDKEGGLIVLGGFFIFPALFAGGGYAGQLLRRWVNRRREASVS